jgi:hypothetical protein
VSVSAEDVRDVLNVDSSDISDAKILKMLKRAAVTLGLELSLEINYTDCTEAQKEAITLLAALYIVCFLNGGSAVGLNFSVGDLNVSNTSNLPALEVLTNEFERVLGKLKEPYVGSA